MEGIKEIRFCQGCHSTEFTNIKGKICCPDNNWIMLKIGDVVTMKAWHANGNRINHSGHRYVLQDCCITGFEKFTDKGDVRIHTEQGSFHISYFVERASQLKLF